jgi:hypothetical protein
MIKEKPGPHSQAQNHKLPQVSSDDRRAYSDFQLTIGL